MKVLVTGANGFIASNLIVHLNERNVEIVRYTNSNCRTDLVNMMVNVDFIFHLAGVNRTEDNKQFYIGNEDLTNSVCDIAKLNGRKIPILYVSSIHAGANNDYGVSKLAAEDVIYKYSRETGANVHVYRLSNVFGKWSRPNYNSVVATFCYNICRNIPIKIDNENNIINLVYIDDVIDAFIQVLLDSHKQIVLENEYSITIGDLAKTLYSFKSHREDHFVPNAGKGFSRALYATYLSFQTTEQFNYPLTVNSDDRGDFSEIIKNKDAGQISMFTIKPTFTRGEHYHHTKNEKFIILSGKVRFRFKHILTNELYELNVEENSLEIIETVPGWSHDITNIGSIEVKVLLWSNEVFNKDKPDTIQFKI